MQHPTRKMKHMNTLHLRWDIRRHHLYKKKFDELVATMKIDIGDGTTTLPSWYDEYSPIPPYGGRGLADILLSMVLMHLLLLLVLQPPTLLLFQDLSGLPRVKRDLTMSHLLPKALRSMPKPMLLAMMLF